MPATSPLTAIDHALDAALADPGLDFVVFTGFTIPDARPPDEAMADLLESRIDWLAQRVASAPIPAIPLGMTCTDVTGYARDLLGKHDVHLVGGIELGTRRRSATRCAGTTAAARSARCQAAPPDRPARRRPGRSPARASC